MQRAAVAKAGLPQQFEIRQPVIDIEETGHPVIAPLHHMQRDAGQIQSGKSGHAGSIADTSIPIDRATA